MKLITLENILFKVQAIYNPKVLFSVANLDEGSVFLIPEMRWPFSFVCSPNSCWNSVSGLLNSGNSSSLCSTLHIRETVETD